MITVRTGNYSETEKGIIYDVAQKAIMNICSQCRYSYDCNYCWTNKCPYRHIIDDLSRVSAKFEPDWL